MSEDDRKTGEAIFDDLFDEQAEPEAVEAEDDVVEDEVDAEPQAIADPEDDDDDEDGEDDDLADEVEDWLVEGKFRKDDVDKLAKSYTELESYHSKTVNELRDEIRAEREAAEQRALQMAQAMMQAQQQPLDPVALSQRGMQLEQAALSDPTAAYQAALQTGDDAMVQRVISRVARGLPGNGMEGDAALAQQMQADYQQRMFQYQQQTLAEQVAQQQQELAMMRAQSTVESVVNEFERKYPDYEQVKEFLGDYLQSNADRIDFSSPATLMQQLETAYDAALGRAARMARESEPARQQEKVQQRKRASYVEAGTPGRSRSREPQQSREDAFASELLDFAKSERGNYPF